MLNKSISEIYMESCFALLKETLHKNWMKPKMKTSFFNLEKALAGAPVVTRQGDEVEIFKSKKTNRLLSLSKYGTAINHNFDGKYEYDIDGESEFDLFMLEPDEVKTTGLTFGEALEALKQRKRITRSCWNNKRIVIRLDTFEGSDLAPELRVKTISGLDCPWIPNHQELLAEDWCIVDA